MTVRTPCAPGCTCGRHKRSGKIDWSDPEARRAYNKEQARVKYAESPDASRAAARRWAAENRLYSKYKLTNEAWRDLLNQQDSRCYLCQCVFNVESDKRSIHVDHDHDCCPGERSCGKCIRGLACWSCNRGIGMFKDDPNRIRRVAENLRAAQRRLQTRPE